MEMTNAEIVAEYRTAKTPSKQISVLADLNQCTRKEIVEILREAGCDLPKPYQAKVEKKEVSDVVEIEGTAASVFEELNAIPAPFYPEDSKPVKSVGIRIFSPDEIKAAAFKAVQQLLERPYDPVECISEIRGIDRVIKLLEGDADIKEARK